MSVTSKKDSRIVVRTCRICLDAKSVDMVLIEEQNGWLPLFEFCFGFTLTTKDEPRLLCQICAEKVLSYVKFKEKCHKSHNLWKKVISDVKCNIVKHEGFENLTANNENDNDPITNTIQIKTETFDSIFDDEYDDSIFSNNDELQISIAEVKTKIDDDTELNDEGYEGAKFNNGIVRNKVESEQTKSKTASISNGCVKRGRNKEYTCAKCKCIYGKKKWYLKHIKVCRGMKRKLIKNPEYCYYLGRKYNGQKLDNNMKPEPQNIIEMIGNESDSLLACGLCNLSFSDIKDVYKHLNDHWSNNDLTCKLCDFVGVDLAAIVSHRFSHLPRKLMLFVCHFCEKPQKSLLSLHFHYRKEHLNKAGGYCSRCNREYKIQRLWRKHERMHAAPFKFICDICGKDFNYKCSLVEHMMHHMQHDTRKNICDICGKVMARQRYLKTHKETVHYNAAPIKCNHCNRMFKSQLSLILHMKNVTKEKTLECEVCHKSFITPNLLRDHKIAHSDEKPYSCDLCGNKYKRKAHLTDHLLKHNGLVPQCQICMKTFSCKRSLNRHAAVHTGVRKYRCTATGCERTFYAKKLMLAHLQLRHKSEILEKTEVVQDKIV